jgi:hypothetical protein
MLSTIVNNAVKSHKMAVSAFIDRKRGKGRKGKLIYDIFLQITQIV